MRLLFAAILIFATFNPSGYSWIHWLSSDASLVYKVALGIILLIGWVIYLRATWHSIGIIGIVIAACFFGVIIWLFIEWGWISLNNSSVVIWLVEIVLSGILAIGMSWAHVRRRLTGQYTTSDIEE